MIEMKKDRKLNLISALLDGELKVRICIFGDTPQTFFNINAPRQQITIPLGSRRQFLTKRILADTNYVKFVCALDISRIFPKIVKVGEKKFVTKKFELFEALAFQMSKHTPTSPKQAEAILQKALDLGFTECFLITEANAMNVDNKSMPDTGWLVLAEVPRTSDRNLRFNEVLRKRGSRWRLTTAKTYRSGVVGA